MELPQRYDPKISEKKWQEYWEKEQVFKFNPDTQKEIFSVDTPPPTMSGRMHLGHAFSYTQTDFMVRYRRMNGYEVFYPFGTDDNGLPTERLVEKEKKVKGSRMDRTEFIKLCQEFIKETRSTFIQDWKNFGVSCDWDIMYSTIDDHCQKISQESFIKLYHQNRVYQKEAPTIWCPQCETAIAQAELEDVDHKSHFNDIVFTTEDGDELIIGTTRPEMLSACVSIFAHPEDKRYQHLFGKKAKTPLYDIWVPILPDEKADPEKGTGIVMCCTFGDQTDIEWYKKHNLPLKVAITRDGKMTERSEKYIGMRIDQARKEIINDLKAANLLRNQKEISHAVNVHERCKTPVEIMHSKQWFVKYLDKREELSMAAEELSWFPYHMKGRLDNWINGLSWDWCISRQRFFGIAIPVWYCNSCGKEKVADESQLPVYPVSEKPLGKCDCGSDEFIPETDVLDTWATSSHTPDIATRLFENHPVHKKLFPMSVRPQAHDIINFWLFYTLVKSRLLHGCNPWKEVDISGWALDSKGKKMSKSLGNVVAPQDILEKYSADAIRYWSASSKLGDDIPFQEKDIVAGHRLVNKIWNASKFAIMNLEGYVPTKPQQFETIDKWILSLLHQLIDYSTKRFNENEYAKAKLETEMFFYQKFCDNYLEIVKDRMYNSDKYSKESIDSLKYTLYAGVLGYLKLFSPFVPHITEELYQLFFKQYESEKSIHVSLWPVSDSSLIDESAELSGALAVDIIARVRKEKSQNQLSLKAEVEKISIQCDEDKKKAIEAVVRDIKSATIAKEILFETNSGTELETYKDVIVTVQLGDKKE